MIKKTLIVRINLNIILKDAAFIWYIIKLFNLERVKLRVDENKVEKWCFAILKKFKEFIEITFHKLIFEKYIIHDIKTRRKSAGYVQTILRYIKTINIDNVEN